MQKSYQLPQTHDEKAIEQPLKATNRLVNATTWGAYDRQSATSQELLFYFEKLIKRPKAD